MMRNNWIMVVIQEPKAPVVTHLRMIVMQLHKPVEGDSNSAKLARKKQMEHF